MTKSLRAADLGYTWPERLPDGATWTRDGHGRHDLWQSRDGLFTRDDFWFGVTAISPGVRKWLGLTPPDFGDRHWEECILIKGQEPPEPAKAPKLCRCGASDWEMLRKNSYPVPLSRCRACGSEGPPWPDVVEPAAPELPPCPPGDGWIEWHGGECPVPPTTDVDVQLRNGDVTTDNFVGDSRARDWLWETDGGDGDIIRYRVHQPQYRHHTDAELMTLYASSAELIRKDKMGGGRVDSWTRILGELHIGISGDSSKWSAKGLWLYWEHRDGSPCGVEVSE